MFCTACGHQKQEENALFCAHCGAGGTAGEVPPAGVRGWSWGAFLLNWIWAIGNRTFIGLFALIPWVGFGVALWLGIKGREMAWKNARWDSVEHFNRVQRQWSQWAIGYSIVIWLASIFFIYHVVTSEKNDITPFSQELLDAIANNADSADSADATVEQDEDCSTNSEE